MLRRPLRIRESRVCALAQMSILSGFQRRHFCDLLLKNRIENVRPRRTHISIICDKRAAADIRLGFTSLLCYITFRREFFSPNDSLHFKQLCIRRRASRFLRKRGRLIFVCRLPLLYPQPLFQTLGWRTLRKTTKA